VHKVSDTSKRRTEYLSRRFRMRAIRTDRYAILRRAAGLKFAVVFVAGMAVVIIIAALAVRSASVSAPVTVETILSFTSMAGVDDAFLNNTAVRGVQGDGLPWDVGTVDGSLTTDGHLHLAVTGIVFSDDPEVPPQLRGINDDEEFRAVVSCLTTRKIGRGQGHGLVVTTNIVTEGFPATRSGDSTIDTNIALPNPCVAPIIFVIGGDEERWFAVTGSYEEE
jgi:hypothetical protein